MPKYEVRYNVEYIIQVEAKDEDEAYDKAHDAGEDDWDTGKSRWAAELLPEERPAGKVE